VFICSGQRFPRVSRHPSADDRPRGPLEEQLRLVGGLRHRLQAPPGVDHHEDRAPLQAFRGSVLELNLT
jgi:hypothetical protein